MTSNYNNISNNNTSLNIKKSHILFFLERLYTLCAKYIEGIFIYNNCNFITLYIDSKNLNVFLFLLKKYFWFQVLSELACVDFLKRKYIFNKLNKNNERFLINYVLVSYKYNIYINIATSPKPSTTTNDRINSIELLFNNANWLEREGWDMFGIIFNNHSDLRRIFTDYGFNGFPLRKDFPVTGFVELRYDDEKKTLVYEPVQFAQEFRVFSFINPWDTYSNT